MKKRSIEQQQRALAERGLYVGMPDAVLPTPEPDEAPASLSFVPVATAPDFGFTVPSERLEDALRAVVQEKRDLTARLAQLELQEASLRSALASNA